MQMRRAFDEPITSYEDDEELIAEGASEADGVLVVEEESVASITKSFKDQLTIFADEEFENLGAQINETFDELNNSISPRHAKDIKRLEDHTFEAIDLYKDLYLGHFITSEGIRAASFAHDMERIKDNEKDAFALYKAISLGKFLTEQGRKTASIKQDLARLECNIDNALQLFKDISLGRFLTQEGVATALHAQDAQRLIERADDINGLKRDLYMGRFLTEKGRAEAERLIDQ